MSSRALTIVLALAACGEQGARDGGVAARDARGEDALADAAVAGEDASVADAEPEDARVAPPDGGAPPPDAASADRCEARRVSAPPLVPERGELFLAHLGLGGFAIGESTLAVLPDGARLIIDVGNDSHADEVVAAADALFGARSVDAIVLTHHHADHEDGLTDVLAAVSTRLLVHRGLTDLTPAANEATMASLCAARAAAQELELCTNGDRRCVAEAWSAPATGCPGLPFALGALRLLAANATVDGDALRPLLSDDNNGENARSVVGVIAHGAFRYVFAGDLTGGGSDTDAVEGFLVAHLGARLPAADVLHLSHHARDTSSSSAWLGATLPGDGKPRSAVAGISQAHLGSPHGSVVADVSQRLAGGALFVTRVAGGGASAGVVDARGGSVRVATLRGGAAYRVQALDPGGQVIDTLEATSASGCAR